MIYETSNIDYVEIVNPVAYYQAMELTRTAADCWAAKKLRSSEKGTRNWDVIKDHKLVVPLADLEAFWRQRVVVA